MTKHYLLIDISYICFNKFYSTKKYYTLSKPELSLENVESWKNIPGFIEQFSRSTFKDLRNIKTKLNINWENIIIVKDCPRKLIWRNSLYNKYKSTRDEMHKKQNFNGGELFKHMYNNLIPLWIKDYNIKFLSQDTAEADDVIAIVTKYLHTNTDNFITIIANDNDYLQLAIDDRVRICTNKLKYKVIDNYTKELWIKILTGDISDNIQACFISKKIIGPKYKNPKKIKPTWVKCTKRNIGKLLDNPEFINTILENTDLIENKQHLINRQLIDFNYIPEDIKTNVIDNFLKI